MKRAFKAAFPFTIPVLSGYVSIGTAYGIYMRSLGFPWWYPPFCALTVFAGAMQFVLTNLLTGAFAPLYVLLLTLMINARHLFYSVSMLDKYGPAPGRFKWYTIFAMTDETFSVNVSATPPEGVDPHRFRFAVSLMDQCYWFTGCLIGGMLGGLISFDTHGIDFMMTALFVVIFLEQWLTSKQHLSALIGVGASVLCLLVFGADSFILPAMLLILALLLILRKPLERGEVFAK